MQLFVKGLGAYELPCSATGLDLKLALQARQGIPAGLQHLVYAGKQVQDGLALRQQQVGPCATLHLVFRLLGGKGGFGALLRGAGRAAATENQDACRDLSGRRLRHVNADKKLKEWAIGAKERELEALGAKHALELQKATRQEARAKVDVSDVQAAQEQARNSVLAAVKSGLKRQKAFEGEEPVVAGAKRARHVGLPELSDSDSEEEVEEEVEAEFHREELVHVGRSSSSAAVTAH